MHAEDKGSKCTLEGKHILILFHDINTATKIKTDCEISIIGQTGNNLPQLELIFQGNLFRQFFPSSKRQIFAKIEKMQYKTFSQLLVLKFDNSNFKLANFVDIQCKILKLISTTSVKVLLNTQI